MNQNVFGVILFSLIVGTAIFVSEYFAPIPPPPSVYKYPVTVTEKYSCSHRSRETFIQNDSSNFEVKIQQAVLNPRSNLFSANFLLKRENSEAEVNRVSIHFFVKDNAKTEYLATETMPLRANFTDQNTAIVVLRAPYKWLNTLKGEENVYVIAEPAANFNNSKSPEPKFDETKAIPVLLDKGK